MNGEWFNDIESDDALPGRSYYPNLYSCDDCGIVSVAHERWQTCPVCALLEKLGMVLEPVTPEEKPQQ